MNSFDRAGGTVSYTVYFHVLTRLRNSVGLMRDECTLTLRVWWCGDTRLKVWICFNGLKVPTFKDRDIRKGRRRLGMNMSPRGRRPRNRSDIAFSLETASLCHNEDLLTIRSAAAELHIRNSGKVQNGKGVRALNADRLKTLHPLLQPPLCKPKTPELLWQEGTKS